MHSYQHTELEVEDGPEFPVGTIIAINVEKILFIVPGGTCDDEQSTATVTAISTTDATK